MKAYSYLRVSSLGQVELDGFSRQRDTVVKYAKQNDIAIVEEFREEGVPGKTEMHDRPGLAALLARLETSDVKLVLVEIADRLARDSVVSELIIREFQKLGVRIVSASGGIDLTAGSDDNPTAKLVRQILAAVAEFDRCIIVLKTRVARERLRAKNGKCEGRKAYGTLDSERDILKEIMQMDSAGYLPTKIARILNREGKRTRMGSFWNCGTLWRIIKRNRPLRTANTPKLER